jgi:hypothetical protein
MGYSLFGVRHNVIIVTTNSFAIGMINGSSSNDAFIVIF